MNTLEKKTSLKVNDILTVFDIGETSWMDDNNTIHDLEYIILKLSNGNSIELNANGYWHLLKNNP